MKRDHKGDIKGFNWNSKAWYAGVIRVDDEESIDFGLYAIEGGTSGEMTMVWKELCGREVPRLKIYDDAWSALSLFPDLIQELGKRDNDNITPEEFVEILLSCGFKDLTKHNKE